MICGVTFLAGKVTHRCKRKMESSIACRSLIPESTLKLNSHNPLVRKTKMKVRASVKKICVKCKIIHRHGVVRVACVIPKHKQRQG